MRANTGAGNGGAPRKQVCGDPGAPPRPRPRPAPRHPGAQAAAHPPPLSEAGLHAAVADLLGSIVRPPAMWTCFPAGNVPLPRAYAVKLARMGLQRGWPDFILIHAARPYGIELKTARGQLSKTRLVDGRIVAGQEDTHYLLQGAGMEIAVCRSVEDVLATLEAWQIPTLTVR